MAIIPNSLKKRLEKLRGKVFSTNPIFTRAELEELRSIANGIDIGYSEYMRGVSMNISEYERLMREIMASRKALQREAADFSSDIHEILFGSLGPIINRVDHIDHIDHMEGGEIPVRSTNTTSITSAGNTGEDAEDAEDREQEIVQSDDYPEFTELAGLYRKIAEDIAQMLAGPGRVNGLYTYPMYAALSGVTQDEMAGWSGQDQRAFLFLVTQAEGALRLHREKMAAINEWLIKRRGNQRV